MVVMFTEELTAAERALEVVALGFDARCSGREALRVVERMGTICRLAEAIVAKAAKRVADTDAHVSHGERSAAELCARLAGVRAGEVRRAIETASRLESLPTTDAAVREGRLSGLEAELISAVAVRAPEAESDLLCAAADGLGELQSACVRARARVEDPAERAARHHAARSCKTWTAADGMFEGRFRLAPEVGAAVKAALEQRTARRFREDRGREANDAYAADALADFVLAGEGEAKRVGYTAHVVIDHEALVRGQVLPGERCEIPGVGPVNARWVRDLLGEAFVTAIVRKGKDVTTVAHFGRHIPAELRTAMIVSGRECSIEGCPGREYLELDHCEIDHAKGGPTAKWNLAWLCAIHHRRKSRGWLLGPPDPRTGKRTLTEPGRRNAA
jgi:hypothetical protein